MIFRFETFELDEERGELRHRGEPVEIQPKPLALLALLIRERERIVPIDELLDRLWPDAAVTPGSLTRAVSLARRAIGDTSRAGRLRAFTRRGYRFCGDVVEVGAPALPGAAPVPEAQAAEPGVGDEPFVGRLDAIGVLRAELDDALARRGGLAFVTGPPGIGKTRLLEAFAHETALRGPTVVIARAREGEGTPAFWLWAQVLRRLLAEPAYREAVREVGSASGEIAGLLPELDATPAEDATISAEQRRFAFFDAVSRALSRCGDERPLVIGLEDVHWAGDASLRLLEHLAFELREARVLLVMTARDEASTQGHPAERTLELLRRQSHGREIRLSSFSRAEVASLLEQVMGRRPPPDLTSDLYARTEGVPLFLREAVRMLSERGDLAHPERITEEALELAPQRFDFIQRAFEGLRPETLLLLERAAVVGREFPLALVASLAEIARADALDALDEAEGAGLVEASEDGAGRFRFAHALFQDAAYERLTMAQRARQHQRVADLLTERHAADPDAVISELAHHLSRGIATGDALRAWEAAWRAAAKARRLVAYEQAALHLEQALLAVDHLDPADPARRLETLLALGFAYRVAGERARRRQIFAEALEVARSLDRSAELAQAAIGLCDIGDWSPTRPDQEAASNEALDAALVHAEGASRARLLARRSFLGALRSRERSEPLAREAVVLARESGDPEALQEALYTLHLAISGPYDVAEREVIADEFCELGDRVPLLDTTVLALMDVAGDHIERADAAGLRRRREQAGRAAGARPHPTMVWSLRLFDAGVALLEGRFDDARSLTEEAVLLGRRIAHPYAEGCYNGQRVLLAREQGDLQTVLRIFEPAARSTTGAMHWSWAILGRAQLEAGNEARARSLFEILATNDFDDIPMNLRWGSSLLETAHLCADLEDDARARTLVDRLEPVQHHHPVLGVPVLYGGPISLARARLLALLGERDEALERMEEAAASCVALGARPAGATVAVEQGVLLLRMGRRSAARDLLAVAARQAADLGLEGVRRRAESALGGP